MGAQVPDAMRSLLTDPQTSGGLLVSCAPEAAGQVLELFKAQGFADACVVGHMQAGEAQVVVS
jgi:selenide,water dikinase